MLQESVGHEESKSAKPDLTREQVRKRQAHRRKLKKLIDKPPAQPVVMKIDPEMAAVMLEHNSKNRPLVRSSIKRYGKEMKEGRWRVTGQPIIFASNSRLLDGQNRLYAAVLHNQTFESFVYFGAAPDNFDVIDIGVRRSAGDVFSIHGVPNATGMAAATQWVTAYETGRLNANIQNPNRASNPAEVYEAYLRHTGLQKSAWVQNLFGPLKLTSPSMATAMHYLFAREDRAEADQFMRSLADGTGFTSTNDPCYVARKALQDQYVQHRKLYPSYVAVMLINAWNARRTGRTGLNIAPKKGVVPEIL